MGAIHRAEAMEARVGQLEEAVGQVTELEEALRNQEAAIAAALESAAASLNDGLERGRAEARRLAAQELERVKASLLDVQTFTEQAHRNTEEADRVIEDLRR